jgi:hypothetical protein
MKIKKTFTFRIGTGATPAATPAEPAPAGGTEEHFRPATERYRKQLARFVLCAVAGFLLSFAAILVPNFMMEWFAIPGIALIALSLIIFFTLPGLMCPACGKATDSGFDRFCPICGKAALKVNRLWGTRCDACNRGMGSYKYRNYPVRYCTHCGVLLDARGV